MTHAAQRKARLQPEQERILRDSSPSIPRTREAILFAARRTLKTRFVTPLFSWSYELLFPQLFYFDNDLRCPRGVGPLRAPTLPSCTGLSFAVALSFPCFQALTNPFLRTIDLQASYFQALTNPFFFNSFVFTSIQNPGVAGGKHPVCVLC